MQTTTDTDQFWTPRRIIAVAVIAGALLYLIFWTPPTLAYIVQRTAAILVTIVLATGLAYFLSPFVERFARLPRPLPLRAKRIIGAVLAILLTGTMVVGLFSLTSATIWHEVKVTNSRLEGWGDKLPDRINAWMERHAAAAPDNVKQAIKDLPVLITQWVERYANAEALLRTGANVPRWALLGGSYVVYLFIIPILAFYFVTDSRSLRAGALSLLAEKQRPPADQLLDRLNYVLSRYIRGQLLLCLIIGVLTGAILWGAGVRDTVLLLAILAGLAQLIPIVGSVVVGIPVVAVPLLQHGWVSALIVLILYVVLNIIQANLLVPIILGREVRLHPVIIIIALLIGGEFLGILGMIVAVPVAAMIKVTHQWYRDLPSLVEETR